jgi:RNA polymerase sigma-70 factor (ECF subfamily)
MDVRVMNDEHHSSTLEKSELDDQELVAGVLAGKTALFTGLVARHTGQIYGLALRLLGNSEEAEDVVQETFLRAYAHLNTFRSAASFATWLYRITLNVSRDQLRRRQVRERTVAFSRVNQLWADERYSVDPERVVLALENRQLIEEALKRLPANYRATLLLHEVDGLKLTEVATLMDAPLPTVKSRLQRARMALVTLLDEAAQAERPSSQEKGSSHSRVPPEKGEGG